MTDEYPPCHIVGATLSALIAAQDAGDREGEVLVLDQLNREDAIAGLVAAASLARAVMARTPGGVPAWQAALREMEARQC